MIILKADTSDKTLQQNHEVNKNRKRTIRDLKKLYTLGNREVIICSPGGSIALDYDWIKDQQTKNKVVVVAVKCGHLLERSGIVPDFVVHVDPKKTELDRLYFSKKSKYLISTQCDPEVFDKLEDAGCKIYTFLSRVSSSWAPEHWQSQGSNTTLQSLGLFKWLGNKTFHLCGFDCSWAPGTKTHIDQDREKAIKDVKIIEVVLADGRKVHTNPVFMGAAEEAVRALAAMGPQYKVFFRGDMFAQAYATDVIQGKRDLYGNVMPQKNVPSTWGVRQHMLGHVSLKPPV